MTTQLTKDQEKKLRQEWRTPPFLFSKLEERFTKFYLDAAASKENTLCTKWFGRGGIVEDAMSTPWADHVPDRRSIYCNPGFSNPTLWVQQSIKASNAGRLVVFMARCAPSTRWWKLCEEHHCTFFLMRPRIQFVPAKGIRDSTNMQDNAVIVFWGVPRPRYRIYSWEWLS